MVDDTVSGTYELLSENDSEEKNVFVTFFESIFDGFLSYCSQCYEEEEFVVEVPHNQLDEPRIIEDEQSIRRLRDEELAATFREPIPTVSGFVDAQSKPTNLPGVHQQKRNESTVDNVDQPASLYRSQAQEHHEKRKEFYQVAKKCFNANDRHYFFQLAKEQTRLLEEANNYAAVAILSQNNENNPKDSIDLRRLYVKEAIQALDIFLDSQILSLEHERLITKLITVITGRGKYSVNGVAKIKPAVMDRLQERGLTYCQVNPGHLKVHIYLRALLTNEL